MYRPAVRGDALSSKLKKQWLLLNSGSLTNHNPLKQAFEMDVPMLDVAMDDDAALVTLPRIIRGVTREEMGLSENAEAFLHPPTVAR
jgi:hypothetical protein